MKLLLVSLFFWLLMSGYWQAYGSDPNFLDFLDKISVTEAEILYGDKTLAELPPEALDIVANSAPFAVGETIVVFNQDQGHWEELSIHQADAYSEISSLRGICSRIAMAATGVAIIGTYLIHGGTHAVLYSAATTMFLSYIMMNACMKQAAGILVDEVERFEGL